MSRTATFAFGSEQVACTNAGDSSVGTYCCVCPDCVAKVGSVFVAVRLPPGCASAQALYGVYSPAEARELAAIILQCANEIDGGKGAS